MSAAKAVPQEGGGLQDQFDTANDRFKRSFDSWFWGSMIVATLVHFGVFALWPDMEAEDVSYTAAEIEAVELPPEIDIPPPPSRISRPAVPVIAEASMVDEDITIAATTFEDNPVENLPPPPEETSTDIAAAPTFTPFTVAPDILNRNEVMRAMQREYPSVLRDAGIGGTVRVHFFIDEQGRVQQTRIDQTSGQPALDQAALSVADIYRFSPALNRDKKVPVWISLPITFQVR